MRRLGLSAAVIAGLVVLFQPAAAAPAEAVGEATGEVSLDYWPFCDLIIIGTPRGTYSAGRWIDGLWLYAEGDAVFGTVDRTGRHAIWIDNAIRAGESVVEIEQVGLSLAEAQATYYEECHDWQSGR